MPNLNPPKIAEKHEAKLPTYLLILMPIYFSDAQHSVCKLNCKHKKNMEQFSSYGVIKLNRKIKPYFMIQKLMHLSMNFC